MLEPAGWRESDWWDVVEIYSPLDMGVQNMNSEEIVSAILNDMLTLHFMGWTWGIPWYDFFRFIKSPKQVDRVLEALCDPRIQELTTGCAEAIHIMRLRPDHESLQKAMDIAGRWYEGFEIPEGVSVISLSPKGEELIKEVGLDAAARLVAWKMEMEKNQGNNLPS